MLIKVIDIKQNQRNHKPIDIIYYLNKIGSIYDSKGDFKTALEYYLKCLKIREAALGNQHVDTADSYNDIGSIYQ